MKKRLLTIILLCVGSFSFAQFTTGVVTLTTGMTIKIDTNTTTATLTLTGPSTTWLGIGFNGFSMFEVTDMFIWNSTSNRDYTPSGSHSTPSPDASQSWTISSDTVSGSVRTVVATRALVSTGDYTFLNNNSSINIIYALSNTTTLSQHAGAHSAQTLTRTALGVEDFSLNASSVFPNPSSGEFVVKTKTYLTTVTIYTQTGAFVKTINVENTAEEVELNIKGLETGIYLLELKNDTDTSWKKVIVN
ncbi:T9SS type A sorting domain-containing protein [Flavobacterium sp.]|uniref:DOMON domain-containing protein n=1 Tax=Flavobacterium sp. TaxID=239 RepID=UPI0037528A19